MILVVKDYFEGSSNLTKTYQEDMMGFKITNDHDATNLTVTIHGLTISVKAGETFNGKFAPFRSVTINTTVPYRAVVSAPFDGTITPPPPDTTAPNEVTNLTASNVTETSLTLSWTASNSNDVVGYDIYKDGALLVTVSNTSMEITGLIPLTEYTFSVRAKDGAGNKSIETDVTITTLETDTTPPVLTITQGGNFSDTQTVTMTTNETATTYYTLDGTEPSPSSLIYSAPLTLTDTTTVKAFAKDTAGNESATQTVIYTKVTLVTDGLVLHYDFTNKAGTTSNTITDNVNNVEATLVNVSHDGENDGYIDNRGLTLLDNDYINIPIHTSSINNSINPNNGLTLVITSYDTNGVLFRTDDGTLRVHTSSVLQSTFPYLTTNGTTKNHAHGVSSMYNMETGVAKGFVDILHPRGTNKTNMITMRFNVNHTIHLFLNGYKDNGSSIPQDFVEFVNILARRPLQLNRNTLLLNNGSESIVNFSIYNRALTDEEVLHNYKYFTETELLQTVSVQPSNVTLRPGEAQLLYVSASPSQYTTLLNNTFQSGNEGYVTVDENGILTGVVEGETLVTVTSTYEGQTFTNYVNVTVGGQTSTPPASTRTIDGMSINRQTDTIHVGENFVVMATALTSELPYDIYNDNIVLWESSDPSVAKIQYGVVEGVSRGTATLTAYDATKSYSKSFDITVLDPVAPPLTEEEIYYVNANDYSIKLNNIDSTNTTNGIQNAFDYASANSYKKIVFPYGTYLISPAVRTIYPPSDMIIDFSDSILNIEPSSLTATGYRMFFFKHLRNTKLLRTHIYGEADSTTVKYSVEGCISVLIQDCLHTGFESCTFSKSPGFNVITGGIPNTFLGRPTQSISITKSNFELGNIDEHGQIDNRMTANYYRYNQFIDVSGLGEYYLLGYTQGYHGYPHLRSRLYSIHFYDGDYNHIESQMYNLQYYNYNKPANAKYAKIVIYQEGAPTTGDTDFGNAVAFIRTLGLPINCFIKNCTFEDNFSTGLAMCSGQNWFIEGNTFSNNRGRMPGCDIDWEDGWEHMVGDVIKNNTFHSPLGIVFSAGSSLALFQNTFNRSAIMVWGRTQNYRLFHNIFNGRGSIINEFNTQGDSVLARNIFRDGATYKIGIYHTGASYKVHELNNTVV